ncbi:adenylosuccinate lyase [Brachybacterium nesterenkovii]|uniref:Adenylosuccinate lyase n=1 Tax=Brachybacterium nesterenkovii TaxID=47847 RepID=A0A1X6X551_9MICO|nr:adenylosuccinate lyase [Brachybacterium nesterenkovii]SLM94064.1 Adenylosuccinate lyase [Brachybacterium nesterenkovii]
MSSHVLDMLTIGNSFGTPAMREVWSEEARLRRQLDVEAALARAEARLGLIPAEAGDAIAEAATGDFDLGAIAAEAARVMHSLNATVHALQHAAGEHGEWVHYGVTTQDVVDTGTILQIRDAIALLRADLVAVATALAHLARTHRDTPMVARTHFVQALPTTFGFKAAIWLDEILRHVERFDRAAADVLVGNINGAVGTYASFDGRGREVERGTLELLGLAAPRISWQSSRDRIAAWTSTLALVSATLGKIATELSTLMHTEIGEVEEAFTSGKIGSTTMPHKRNPALLEGAAALTAPVKHAAALVLDGMATVHERDAISWRAEWVALPEIHQYLSAQLAGMGRILSTLVVHADAMARNLDLQGGLLLSEKAMFEIGRVLGKQTAHTIVYDAAMTAAETGDRLEHLLAADPRVAERFDEAQIASWLEPREYLGETGEAVDAVLAGYDAAGLA